MNRLRTLIVLALMMAASHTVAAAALDDIKLEVSHELCEGVGANENSVFVYATNLNSTQSIDANFKYDSKPAQQHFILFDANLNPITDRFPKFHVRRLSPRESARIGCTYTYRAAPQPPGPLSVPIVIAKQSAAYVDANAAEAPAEDARSFAVFLLQGGINECAAGAKPRGLFYLVNLHPYARLSASMNLLDDHGTRVGVLTPNLSPMSAARVACSNGFSKPGPISSATLEASAGVAASLPAAPAPEATPQLPEHREPQPIEAPTLAPLSLDSILRTQNVCAGSVTPGWIKINDAWNPTVCGNPATIIYNVWTLQQLSDQPVGAVVHACKGTVPPGWAIVGSAWNPTVCGHPTSNQPNVMIIKRLD
jgi:cell division septation protein DedD